MNKKVIIIISIVIVVLLVGGISTYLIINHNNEVNERLDDLEKENKELKKDKKKSNDEENEDDYYTIPDVSGMSLEKAKKELKRADENVEIDVDEKESDEIAEGYVVKTIPRAGKKRKKGSDVTIFIAVPSTRVYVEDYTDRNYLEVKAELESHGIKVTIETKESSSSKEGVVVDQSVKSGKRLYEGDSIILYISKNSVIVYPDFTDGNYSAKEVKEFCDKYGVGLSIQIEDSIDYSQFKGDKKILPGRVFYQDRLPGNVVKSGDFLTIKVLAE